jgi:hypothetical protein
MSTERRAGFAAAGSIGELRLKSRSVQGAICSGTSTPSGFSACRSMLWGGASRSRKAEALRGLIACRATWAADWEGPSIEGDEPARGLGYVVPDSNQSLQGVGPGGHAP